MLPRSFFFIKSLVENKKTFLKNDCLRMHNSRDLMHKSNLVKAPQSKDATLVDILTYNQYFFSSSRIIFKIRKRLFPRLLLQSHCNKRMWKLLSCCLLLLTLSCPGWMMPTPDDSRCRAGPDSPVCSDNGVCVDGFCECRAREIPQERYSGQFCECSNFNCPRQGNL